MEQLYSSRVELEQPMASAARSAVFARVLDAFDGHVVRLPNGRIAIDLVVPGDGVGEASAQSLHVVAYAGRQAGLPGRAVALVVHPATVALSGAKRSDARDEGPWRASDPSDSVVVAHLEADTWWMTVSAGD